VIFNKKIDTSTLNRLKIEIAKWSKSP